MSLQDVQEVYQNCAGEWTGLDWSRLWGAYDIDGMDPEELRADGNGTGPDTPYRKTWLKRHAASIRDDFESQEDALDVLAEELVEAADYLDAVAADAVRAEEDGKAAIEAARRGDLYEALEHARLAARVEGKYGDCPVWGRLVAALEEELERVESEEMLNQNSTGEVGSEVDVSF